MPLEQATTELSRDRRRSESIEQVAPYAAMGMSSDEIRCALIIDRVFTDQTLPSKNAISFALRAGRERGKIRSLTDQESEDIKIDFDNGRTSFDEQVVKWLLTKELLTFEGDDLPENRLSWKKSIADWEEEIAQILPWYKSLMDRGATLADLVKIHKVKETESLSSAEKSVVFARGCIDSGFIKEELKSHIILTAILKMLGKKYDFPSMIRLEAFTAARIAADRHNNPILLNTYVGLGNGIDPKWFGRSLAEAEYLIREHISGSDSGGNGHDNMGNYTEDNQGRKWRIPEGIDPNGNIVYAGSPGIRSAKENRECLEKIRKIEEKRRLRGPFSSLR